MSAVSPNPVRVDARLDPQLSRWLWLVKWLLAIPHFIVLLLLFIAFVVLTIVAFFAILFTGRYPRSIFDFNLGVLRWAWRVGVFLGGGWFAWGRGWDDDGRGSSGGPGLILLLVLIAAIALLFTTRYPRGIFDFVVGLNRWVFRVVAYAALMTDVYPPFRLDQGGPEPGPSAPEGDVAAGA